MRTDVRLLNESASPLLHAPRLVYQSQPHLVQPVRVHVHCNGDKGQQV